MKPQQPPLVSIVVPSFNTNERLFCACIRSIVGQTYQKIEIIVIDDGSSSSKISMFDWCEKQDTRIRVFHQENGGEGAARNRGLDEARGDYVVFVDADDGMPKNWIESAVCLAKKADADIVMGRVLQVSSIPDEDPIWQAPLFRVFGNDDFYELQIGYLVETRSPLPSLPYLDIGVCSKLIRKSCVDSLRFPVGITISSDQVYNHAMLRNARCCVVTDQPSYYYVSNGESVSHIYQPKAVDFMMKSMSLVEPYLIDSREVRSAFCHRVILEMCNGIQFSAFSDKHPLPFTEKVAAVIAFSHHPYFKQVVSRYRLPSGEQFQNRLKAWLLKHSFGAAYVLLKDISDHK